MTQTLRFPVHYTNRMTFTKPVWTQLVFICHDLYSQGIAWSYMSGLSLVKSERGALHGNAALGHTHEAFLSSPCTTRMRFEVIMRRRTGCGEISSTQRDADTHCDLRVRNVETKGLALAQRSLHHCCWVTSNKNTKKWVGKQALSMSTDLMAPESHSHATAHRAFVYRPQEANLNFSISTCNSIDCSCRFPVVRCAKQHENETCFAAVTQFSLSSTPLWQN